MGCFSLCRTSFTPQENSHIRSVYDASSDCQRIPLRIDKNRLDCLPAPLIMDTYCGAVIIGRLNTCLLVALSLSCVKCERPSATELSVPAHSAEEKRCRDPRAWLLSPHSRMHAPKKCWRASVPASRLPRVARKVVSDFLSRNTAAMCIMGVGHGTVLCDKKGDDHDEKNRMV